MVTKSIHSNCIAAGNPAKILKENVNVQNGKILMNRLTDVMLYSYFLKRTIDFIVAFFVLAVIWPILLLLIIFLHFTNKGAGVFFTQERPGKNARIFKAIKFKTMTDKRDSEGNLLPDAERLTKIGKIVRSLSIDELPQLINMY